MEISRRNLQLVLLLLFLASGVIYFAYNVSFGNDIAVKHNLSDKRFSDAEIMSRVKKHNFLMKRHQTIAEKDIFKNLVPYDSNSLHSAKCSHKIWKENSSVPYHQMNIKNWTEISKSLAKRLAISEGGEWQPDHCDSQFWVAIIIPVQNRESNLRQFLLYIHPFLREQLIRYKIYVMELASDKAWNKGLLFNAGFVEATKDKPFPCVILHDVDTLPTHRNHIYACTTGPRFMVAKRSPPLETRDYAFTGGAVAISSDHYKLVNGFSNKFLYWGSEDTDFYNRVIRWKLPIMRFEPPISSFLSLPHPLAKRNDAKSRYRHFIEGMYRTEEGLNTTKYKIIKRANESLCTRIVISY